MSNDQEKRKDKLRGKDRASKKKGSQWNCCRKPKYDSSETDSIPSVHSKEHQNTISESHSGVPLAEKESKETNSKHRLKDQKEPELPPLPSKEEPTQSKTGRNKEKRKIYRDMSSYNIKLKDSKVGEKENNTSYAGKSILVHTPHVEAKKVLRPTDSDDDSYTGETPRPSTKLTFQEQKLLMNKTRKSTNKHRMNRSAPAPEGGRDTVSRPESKRDSMTRDLRERENRRDSMHRQADRHLREREYRRESMNRYADRDLRERENRRERMNRHADRGLREIENRSDSMNRQADRDLRERENRRESVNRYADRDLRERDNRRESMNRHADRDLRERDNRRESMNRRADRDLRERENRRERMDRHADRERRERDDGRESMNRHMDRDLRSRKRKSKRESLHADRRGSVSRPEAQNEVSQRFAEKKHSLDRSNRSPPQRYYRKEKRATTIKRSTLLEDDIPNVGNGKNTSRKWNQRKR